MSCEATKLDARGALLNIDITKDTVFNKTVTVKDSDGETVALSGYDDLIFRIFSDPVTEFTLDGGDMSLASEIVTFDFAVTLAVAKYSYQFVGENSTGEVELLRGKLDVNASS